MVTVHKVFALDVVHFCPRNIQDCHKQSSPFSLQETYEVKMGEREVNVRKNLKDKVNQINEKLRVTDLLNPQIFPSVYSWLIQIPLKLRVDPRVIIPLASIGFFEDFYIRSGQLNV